MQQLQELKFQLDSEPRSEVSGQGNKVCMHLEIMLHFVVYFVGMQLIRYSPKILSLDLSKPSSLAEKCEEAIGFYGRVDILVNNAGVGLRGDVMDTDISVDRRIMEVNFFGTVALTKGEGVSPHKTGSFRVIQTIFQLTFKHSVGSICFV